MIDLVRLCDKIGAEPSKRDAARRRPLISLIRKSPLMIVWAMHDVVAWLESLDVNTQHYPQLLAKYKDILDRYSLVYATLKGHAPILEKVIDMAMDLSTARREIKRHEKGKSS